MLRRNRSVRFEVDDLVWLYVFHKTKGLSPKLISPWQGPYRITEKKTDVLVKLQTLGAKPMKQYINIARLKKFCHPLDRPQDHIALDPVDDFDYDVEIPALQNVPDTQNSGVNDNATSDNTGSVSNQFNSQTEEEQFEIEVILGVRGRGPWEFLVRWKGYDASHDMWLAENELNETAEELLKEFFIRKGWECDCKHRSHSNREAANHRKECKTAST